MFGVPFTTASDELNALYLVYWNNMLEKVTRMMYTQDNGNQKWKYNRLHPLNERAERWKFIGGINKWHDSEALVGEQILLSFL